MRQTHLGSQPERQGKLHNDDTTHDSFNGGADGPLQSSYHTMLLLHVG